MHGMLPGVFVIRKRNKPTYKFKKNAVLTGRLSVEIKTAKPINRLE